MTKILNFLILSHIVKIGHSNDDNSCNVGNFLGGDVCKRHMNAGARDLEDRGQMVPDVTNRSHRIC